jgi:hypothetical protein
VEPNDGWRRDQAQRIQSVENGPSAFYQIWILPEKDDLAPGYEPKMFAPDDKRGRLKLVASDDTRGGSLKIN